MCLDKHRLNLKSNNLPQASKIHLISEADRISFATIVTGDPKRSKAPFPKKLKKTEARRLPCNLKLER